MLFLSFEYPPAMTGGIAAVARDKANYYQQHDYDVVLLAPWLPGTPSFLETKKRFFRVARLPVHGIGPKLIVAAVWAMWSAIVYRPVVIYSMTGTYSGMVAALTGRLFRIPVCVMAHGNEFVRFEHVPIVRSLIAWVYSVSEEVFAVSSYTKTSLLRFGVPRRKIEIVYNGYDRHTFFVPDSALMERKRAELSVNDEQFVLVTVSRLDPRKGHETVIRALHRLFEKNPELRRAIRYVIAGRGPTAHQLHELVGTLGLDDTVAFLGFVSESELPLLYGVADVCIMPSVTIPKQSIEGFGVVFLEAAACGTCAIAGTAGGMADAVVHGKTGLLVDGASIDSVTDAVWKLYTNRDLCANMSRTAQERAERQFTMEKIGMHESAIVNQKVRRA